MNADNACIPYQDPTQIMARAVWFVRVARNLRLPTKLQRFLLEQVGGLAGLWDHDIMQVYSVLQNPDEFDELDVLKDKRVRSFVDANSDRLKEVWLDPQLRSDASCKASRWVNSEIHACDVCQPDFPYRLREISGCPAILFYRGSSLSVLNQIPLCATIVGTRIPTPYGKRVAEQIAGELAAYPVAIISGLARGIDTLVHRKTLEVGGFTTAVLGCGPDIVYPPENRLLQDQIAKSGLLISEHPPGTMPIKQYFPARNRLLSGLADLVVVTESTRKSGTLLTAGFAADQGRDVYAVPGNVLQKTSSGCHSLIRDGALLLESAREIIDACQLSRLPSDSGLHSSNSNAGTCKKDIFSSDPLQKKIACCLMGSSMDISDLSLELNEPVGSIAAAVTRMELSGRIECSRGRYFLTDSISCSI